MRLLSAASFALALGGACMPADGEASMGRNDAGGAGRAPGSVPPARDGNIAIREEYEAALAAGTRAALELFMARHPGHPLAAEARAALGAAE